MCAALHIQVLGALVIALGFFFLLFGFYRGLANLRDFESTAVLAFLAGMVAIIAGGWIMNAC